MLDWKRLVLESDEQLAARDVAEIHLACATDLPDAGKIDVDRCRDRLDYYARRVRSFTEAHMYQFYCKRRDYNNSEGYFRILCMITVLQRDLGVRYNPAKIPDEVPLETADRFIHGVLFGAGGSCGSLAVVYTAVGRRLGYPLKLVHARRGPYGHLFPRWDDPQGERFNIEATNQGFGRHTDDHYRTGRFKVDVKTERQACLLQSMTPREELANFLGDRGCCWRDLGMYRLAAESFAWGGAVAPRNKAYLGSALMMMNRWRDVLNARKPPSFPKIYTGLGERRYPETLPRNIEQGILSLEATEFILTNETHEKAWLGALRKGLPANVPTAAFVDYSPKGALLMRFKYAKSDASSECVTDNSTVPCKSSPDAFITPACKFLTN